MPSTLPIPTTDEATSPSEVHALTRRAHDLNVQIRAVEQELQAAMVTSANAAGRWTLVRDESRVDPAKSPAELEARTFYTTATKAETALRDTLKEHRAAIEVVSKKLQAALQTERAAHQRLVSQALQRDYAKNVAALTDAIASIAALHIARGQLAGRPIDVVQAVARAEEGFNGRVARRVAEIRAEIISSTSKDN